MTDPTTEAAAWWRLADLSPWGENPRAYSKAAVNKLADLIVLHGFNTTINAHWPTRRIVRGHRRRLALLELLERDPGFAIAGSPGPGYVPVRWVGGAWEDLEADALADNRAQEDGAWDVDQIGRLAQRWTDEGRGLAAIAAATAFGDAELREILARLEPERPRPEQVGAPACPEPPPRPSSLAGEVYELGPHRLICGDTTSLDDVARLMDGSRCDAVITDPPFAIYGSSTGLGQDIADDKVIRPFFRDVLASAMSAARPHAQVYVCCDWRSWSAWWEAAQRCGLKPSNMLIWDKGDAGLGSQWGNVYEIIGFWTNKPQRTMMRGGGVAGSRNVLRPNILRDMGPPEDGPERLAILGTTDPDDPEPRATSPREMLAYGRVRGRERVHNAAKPIPLLQELISASTDEGGHVVDLFGGGGSTLLAAARAGRRASLVEIDPRWCDVIRHRWTQWAREAGVDPGPGALDLEVEPTQLATKGGRNGKGKRKA